MKINEFLTKYFSLYFSVLIFLGFLPLSKPFLPSIFQSIISFSQTYLGIVSLISSIFTMIWLTKKYAYSESSAIRFGLSVIGVMALVPLILPFSIIAFLNFNLEKLVTLGYIAIWVLLHGVIVYVFSKYFSKKLI